MVYQLYLLFKLLNFLVVSHIFIYSDLNLLSNFDPFSQRRQHSYLCRVFDQHLFSKLDSKMNLELQPSFSIDTFWANYVDLSSFLLFCPISIYFGDSQFYFSSRAISYFNQFHPSYSILFNISYPHSHLDPLIQSHNSYQTPGWPSLLPRCSCDFVH